MDGVVVVCSISDDPEVKKLMESQIPTVIIDMHSSKSEVVVDNGMPYYHRFFEDIVKIGPKPQSYQFEWNQPEDAQLGLKFLLGNMEGVSKKKHPIDFRDVKLEAKGARAFLEQLEGTDATTK
ncbi:hypothetical protein [Sutcliffiella horikoshii]|uniref:hypothetical protein n=1 Tax=Sutcliffiella horikoshii TaxID=79883 RepID=UPI003850E353